MTPRPLPVYNPVASVDSGEGAYTSPVDERVALVDVGVIGAIPLI